MCSRPSVEVPSRGSHLLRTSSRIPAALLLHASPVFDNKRVICRARDAIARLNAACALLRSRRAYLLYGVSQKWRLAFLRPAHCFHASFKSNFKRPALSVEGAGGGGCPSVKRSQNPPTLEGGAAPKPTQNTVKNDLH
jgi:hypothetical protein